MWKDNRKEKVYKSLIPLSPHKKTKQAENYKEKPNEKINPIHPCLMKAYTNTFVDQPT